MKTNRRLTAIWTLCALVLSVGMLFGCTAPQQQGSSGAATEQAAPAEESAPEVDLAATFPSWNPQSESLNKLVTYVAGVCDEGSETYVDPAERLATFDMDGTILCEKAPVYLDYCLLMYRVLEDPSYEAPAEYVQTCEQLRANANEGIVDSALDDAKNEALTGAFANMEPTEFYAYVEDFVSKTQAEGFEGMTYGESFYKPMLEVIDYLRANDFDVYMVSACEREVVRALVGNKLNIAPDHVIGTDWGVKATGQGDEEGKDYTLSQEDELVFDGTKTAEVGKLNKVLSIEREIGRVPLLAFGNSSGDYAMLNYAQSNPNHTGMGLLVLCDDVEREYGDTERATSQAQEAAQEGWTTFSMANDWATIYGEGVVKTQLVGAAEAELAEAA